MVVGAAVAFIISCLKRRMALIVLSATFLFGLLAQFCYLCFPCRCTSHVHQPPVLVSRYRLSLLHQLEKKPPKKKIRVLNFEEKVDIIWAITSGCKKCDTATEHVISISTLSTMLKGNDGIIRATWSRNVSKKKKA